MKWFLGFMVLLVFMFPVSEREYVFDYRFRCETWKPGQEKPEVSYAYVLSTDNSYYAMFNPVKEDTYQFYFLDIDCCTAHADMSDISKLPPVVRLDRTHVLNFSNIYAHKASKYMIEELTDTLIQGKPYARYQFKEVEFAKSKQKKRASHVYVIERGGQLRPFFDDSTILNIWRLRGKIPYGRVVEKHFLDKNGKIESKVLYSEFEQVDFKLGLNI